MRLSTILCLPFLLGPGCHCSQTHIPDGGLEDAPGADDDTGGPGVDAGDPCEGLDEYWLQRWVFDGVPGQQCNPVVGIPEFYGPDQPSFPDVRIAPWNPGDRPVFPDEPACGASIVLDNMWPLETGRSGPLEQFQRFWMEEPDRVRPHGMVVMTIAADGGACNPETIDGVVTAGTWHIVQGGGLGDYVVVEGRDIEFEPFFGHTIRYDLIRWRINL